MKFQILRRAGALVLALVLALTLTVPAWADEPSPSLKIDGVTDTIIQDPGELTLTAKLTNVSEEVPISWKIGYKDSASKVFIPDIVEENPGDLDGTTVTSTFTIDSTKTGPGEFIVTATDGTLTATKYVTFSGLVLSGTKLTGTNQFDKSMEMLVNESAALTVDAYGDATGRDLPAVQWESSSPSIVSVMLNAGSLTAWQLGKGVEITASKGKYEATCTVDVVEDEDVIADNYQKGYTASVSNPLILSEVYPELNDISTNKKDIGALTYINNLSVPTSQGTLYYNYVSSGDTGEGVGTRDAFSDKASGSIRSVDRLYFVPKPGVTGTVDITFNGVSSNGNYSGIIRVNVGTGTGTGPDGTGGEDRYQISYRTRAGEPAWFLTSDFDTFCRSETGRGFNFVTFNLPQPSQGTLYYNYMAGSGNPVSTTTKFTPSGVYTLDNVCFVPNDAFEGEAAISFRMVDTSGETINDGTVIVNVAPSGASEDPTNVYIYGEQGKPVTLQSELFRDACQNTIHDTLAYVTFKLPDPSKGVLYYNYQSSGSYESRVAATTRYYYSGVPGLSSVTFVPGSGVTGRIAIPYTGYGSTGTSFTGTLYIGLDEVDSSTIRYSVAKNGSVTLRASDFYNAGLYQKGVGVDCVVLTDVPSTNLGKLRYDYRGSSNPGSEVSSGTYYVSPSYSWQPQLNLLSFHTAGLTGTVTIQYTAYCGTGTNQQKFDGKVVIQVGAIAAEDVNVSCDTGGRVGLSSYSLSSACDPVMSESMSYIEITGVPAPEEGRLYLNYYGFGTGTDVKPGARFYCAGSPGIDRLTFVPRAGFSGTAEITYTGYSGDGLEQTSGRIKVNVSRSTASRYFNDMGGHVWAIDSVDYLRQNGAVEGVGGSRFAPAETMTKGDFTLMLVRAYGLTASGGVSFDDVPADSYYADAIRIASLLGVAGGSNGYYNPKDALSRQDAMLMIYNALKASGVTVTNGLAADFSAYRDEREIAPYAREAIGSLVQMGVVEGDGGYLRPQRLLSRSEAAKLLHTIMTL